MPPLNFKFIAIKNKRFYNKKELYRINHNIQAKEVRIIDEEKKSNLYTLQTALQMAQAQKLDLIEISRTADGISICKIMEHSKFKYQQKKKQKLIKANSQKIIVKAIGFSPNTDKHDIDFKIRYAIKFLQDQAKLNIYVHFSGREIKFKEKGAELLEKIAKELVPYGKQVEQRPKMEGRRMILSFVPLKVNKNKNE